MQAPIRYLPEAQKNNLEKEDPAAAIKNYLSILRKEQLNSAVYNRLMIVYRKQKEYQKEAELIKKAIEIYEAYYAKHQPSHSAKVTSLSRALAISTGLADRKGKGLYNPEPIATWKKRLFNLKKKLK